MDLVSLILRVLRELGCTARLSLDALPTLTDAVMGLVELRLFLLQRAQQASCDVKMGYAAQPASLMTVAALMPPSIVRTGTALKMLRVVSTNPRPSGLLLKTLRAVAYCNLAQTAPLGAILTVSVKSRPTK